MNGIAYTLALSAGLALSVSLASAHAPNQTPRQSTRVPAASSVPATVTGILESPSAAVRRHLDAQRGVQHSVARQWNEVLLDSIRRDIPRPTVHARNLYHCSAAMWDAWAAYADTGDQVFHHEKLAAPADVQAAREEAISYAMYRLLRERFVLSPGAPVMFPEYDALMDDLGYDKSYTGTVGDDPASLGNRIAESIITMGLSDGSNEADDYASIFYEPVNPPLLPEFPGNPDILDANRWQPLALEYFVDQNGIPIPTGYPDAIGPEWGNVTPFSLNESDRRVLNRDGFDWAVWHDPGAPPYLGGTPEDDARYKWTFEFVSIWSSMLDPTDGVMVDASPNSIGNAPMPQVSDQDEFYDLFNGNDWGTGRDINPATGLPYEPQIVPRGDYTRILAEFWADGPHSETPPGHWFTLLNFVGDHPLHENRFMGQGPILDRLEWDVKTYLTMGGGMHDCAIGAWSVKGYYDYIRPVSAIRYMCDQGQCSDPNQPHFSPDGVNLIPDYIELVTAQTTAPGQKHEHLAGNEGKIAIKAWRGPDFIIDPDTDTAGVGWILAENWWPYQRPSFVTPPFPGYVSGHSCYSRGAAEIMTLITGDEYFPGGMGEFAAPRNEYLVFEEGPSVDVTLQWATYRDASDQCSLSRIWGGIHPPADDIAGREIGLRVGPEAVTEARRYFGGLISCPADFQSDGVVNYYDISKYIQAYINSDPIADMTQDSIVDVNDIMAFLTAYTNGCP